VPKRRHHTRCSRNGETKAKSRRSVQVERIARSNIALNNAPIDDLRRPGTSAAEKHTALFSQRMVTTEAATGKGKKSILFTFIFVTNLTTVRTQTVLELLVNHLLSELLTAYSLLLELPTTTTYEPTAYRRRLQIVP
jgi:hypothetical protein